MIIVTSIAPGHKNSDNQHHAIKSWQRHGKCVSMNTAAEIEVLQKSYSHIHLVETKKTVYPLLPKKLININAIFELAAGYEEDLFLVNSDIVIDDLPELKQDGITIFSRYDYEENMEESKRFPWGFDGFHIPKEFLNIFPPSVYSLGACWFDLAIPLRAIQCEVPIYYPKGKFIFHKMHEPQWSQAEWERMGRYFIWEFNFNPKMNCGQVATAAMNTITNKFIS